MAVIPKEVIDHCNSNKMCKGCKINCVAPTSDRDFESWIQNQIQKIIATSKKNTAESA